MAPFQADDNVIFLYHCLNNASGKIDWNAVAVATGSTRGAVEIRWRRLKKKIEDNTSTGQPTTSTPAPAAQGQKAGQGKKKKTGTLKRKIEDVDDEEDADVAGPPQVDGQVDIKPYAPRRRTRGKKVNYDTKASWAGDEDSSATTTSEDDEDYVVGAEAVKETKRHKKAQLMFPKAQPHPANAEGKRLHIRNLPHGTTERDLRQFFAGFEVESATVFPKWSDRRAPGYASLDLKSSEDAEEAVRALSHIPIRRQQVTIQVAVNHKPNVTSKPPNALRPCQTSTKKVTAPTKGNDVQQKLLAAAKEKASSGMHPSDIPLPSIEHSPLTSPLSCVFTNEERGDVDEECEIALESLKPGMLLTLPPRDRPQILNGTAEGRVHKQEQPSSPILVSSSISATTHSTTTDSTGKMVLRGFAVHAEIRPEDSVSNIAVRAEQASTSQTATPTGIMANTMQFFKGLLTAQK